MWDALETGFGLDLVLWVQEIRFSGLAPFLEFLDFVGGELFYIILLSLVYWAFNKQLGLRMFFALVTITLLTSFFKDLFARPRPYQASDAVLPIFLEEGYGFPSGHTSASLVVWGILAFHLKRPFVLPFLAIYITLQALGRVVAGVHFPQDVLGGLLLGSLTLYVILQYQNPIANFWNERQAMQQAILACLVSGAIIILTFLAFDDLHAMESYLTAAGLIIGGGIATIIEPRKVQFRPTDSRVRAFFQYFIGIVLCGGLLIGLKAGFASIDEIGRVAAVLRVLRYGIVAFVALEAWPYISLKLGLLQHEE